MGLPLPKNETYTYADYLNWDDSERWELIEGEVYNMSPAPSDEHQDVAWEIAGQIRNFLKDKKCKGRFAPYDVTFPEAVKDNDKIIDVVQPDISVICDTDKIDKKGCHGAPDFIIEILSPSTASKDTIIKKELYEKNGVKEYWIIDPFHKIITVHLLGDDNKYGASKIYDGKGKVEVKTLPELVIDFDDVFTSIEK
jgi:Uma2 family endonuclease